MSTIYIGIDNGASGSYGIVADGWQATFELVPVKKFLDYQKGKPTNVSRLDWQRMIMRLKEIQSLARTEEREVRVVMEKPFTGKFKKAEVSAGRFYEAMLIVLESQKIGYEVISSGAWQKELLPKAKKTDVLKKASKAVATKMFPKLAEKFEKHGDADGLLIAVWASRREK